MIIIMMMIMIIVIKTLIQAHPNPLVFIDFA